MDPYPYGKCAVCGWHGPRAELKKGAPGIEHCPQCNSDDTTWTAVLPQLPDAEPPQADEAKIWLSNARQVDQCGTKEKPADLAAGGLKACVEAQPGGLTEAARCLVRGGQSVPQSTCSRCRSTR
jgi:hypothetical protein